MYTLTIRTSQGVQSISASHGQLLSDVLRRHIPAFAMPCAGNHTCGKCRVTVDGAVSEPDAAERALLGEDALARGIRLACSCRVLGDLTVELQERGAGKIVAWYRLPPLPLTESGCGFAVDIGTTTVVVQLLDRATGRVLAERLAENAQRGFGADVISRIEACAANGVEVLSQRISRQLEKMAQACLDESGIHEVTESVVTGNTTMLHLYEGLDPASLAVSPFRVQSHFGCLSRRTLAGRPVYLPRCVGAYVGADIICAILSAQLTQGGRQLLTDIGTNGEIALFSDGQLLCCATAAGPAFEGAGLECGMPARSGAIRQVSRLDGRVAYSTVGDAPAAGVCGSGILDALAIMLETEALDPSGYLEESWQIGESGVWITQKDVRQIQLAKASICAGLRTLLRETGLAPGDIGRFVIAGGFGSSMDPNSAAAIGLYPAGLRSRMDFVGNGALGGAAMLLLCPQLRQKAEHLAGDARELSLSASPTFMDFYIDSMILEPAE